MSFVKSLFRRSAVPSDDVGSLTYEAGGTNDSHIHSKSFWTERTFLKKVLVFLLCVVMIVGILVLISRASHNRAELPEADKNICLTPECETSALYLINSMDTSVDPCEDFFSFACGGYLRKTSLPGKHVNRFFKLTLNLMIRIKGLLEESFYGYPEHWNKTKEFYNRCMDIKNRELVKSEPLENDLDELGQWPLLKEDWEESNFSWSETLKILFKLGYDKNILMKIEVGVDVKNSSKTILSVDQPSLTMAKILYSLEYPYDIGLTAYKKLILECAKLLDPRLDLVKASKTIDDAMDIEIQLAKASLSPGERNDIFRMNENHTMTLTKLKETYKLIPWDTLFEAFLPENVKPKEDDEVWVPVPSALVALQKILEKDDGKSKRKLANYMIYRAVVMASRDLSNAFSQSFNDFQNFHTGRTYLHPKPWEDCIIKTKKYFFYSLSSAYSKMYFQEDTKEKVSDLLRSIRQVLEEEIKDSDWIDDETQKRALNKAEKIEAVVGYPEDLMNNTVLNNYFKRLSVGNDHYRNVRAAEKFYAMKKMQGLHEKYDRHRWSSVGDLLNANAYYYPVSKNSIQIPVGLLQEETYSPAKPNYLNYGSLGMLLGHELTHAFDMIGSQFDEKGDLEFWWTTETGEKHKERSKCFVEQYNNYTVPDVGENLNGTLTLNENMADTGGLHIAYKAYQKWIQKHGKEKLLPGFSAYSPNQLFWLSFASVWCDKETTLHTLYEIAYEVHPPSRYRVRGALSNLKEFSADFNCRKDSAMNPNTKCLLWS